MNHFAFPNTGFLCSYCSSIMNGSESDHTKEPFEYIVVCKNLTCPHVGIRYRVPRETGIKLERMEEACHESP